MVDYLKFFMSMVVVAIHTHPFADFESSLTENLFQTVASMALPFFFIASGFFLFYNRPSSKVVQIQLCIKTIKKISRFYIYWTVIYFPLTIVGFLRDGLSLRTSVCVFLRNFFLVGENYYSWPLWYCLALIVAVLLIIFFMKIGFGTYRILFISFVFFVLGQVIDHFINFSELNDLLMIYTKIFVSTRNGFFIGFFAVSLGMLVAKINVNLSGRYLLLAFLFSALGAFFCYPLGIITALMLFMIAIKSPIRQFRIDNIKCREAGVIIFFMHMYIIFALESFDLHLHSIVFFSLSGLISLLMVYILFNYRATQAYKLLFC